MAQRLQFRRGTAALATANNVVLGDGELGYETDTGYFKIGDGVTDWNTLTYGGLQTVSGVVVTAAATFPVTATFGQECYRTDLLNWYKWNGTTWTQI